MNHRTPFVARLHAIAAKGVLASVAAVVIACGSGSTSGGTITPEIATSAAHVYFKSSLGLFTGTTEPQEFIDIFAPECRGNANADDLELVMEFMQGLAPELSDIVIEDVDTGELLIEETDEGTLVTPKDRDAFRVKVEGEFISVEDFFGRAGFEPADEDDSLARPIRLVMREGRVFVGDCEELEGLAGGLTNRSS